MSRDGTAHSAQHATCSHGSVTDFTSRALCAGYWRERPDRRVETDDMIVLTGMLYAVARFEVFLHSREPSKTLPQPPDALPPSCVPSVRLGDLRDRILAEVDQNGQCFAVDPRDQTLFNIAYEKEPRRFSEIDIILRDGTVRVRKRPLPTRGGSFVARLRQLLAIEFYFEAASFLRLRGIPGVPTVRRIDTRGRTIEMDYIWGRDIRQEIGKTGVQSCAQIDRIFWNEIKAPASAFCHEIYRLVDAVMSRGVIPRDVHAANFIRGNHTGRLYMFDYQIVYLRPVPGWRTHQQALALQFQCFDTRQSKGS